MGIKLDLRRHFLRTYHASAPPRVLDCCAGSGRIWAQLRREFAVASYWPLDTKAARGRLKINSVRIVGQPGWSEDIVDVDTWGSPWKHWAALLPCVTQPTTVFLTVGRGGPNIVRLRREELDALGLTLSRVRTMSGAITHRLAALAVEACLGLALRHALAVVECCEAASIGNARYFGVRLAPIAAPAPLGDGSPA